MKKLLKTAVCIALSAFLAMPVFTGCKAGFVSLESSQVSEGLDESSEPESEEVSEPEPEPETLRNPLTGEADYPQSAQGKRPVTIMVNNLDAAVPHRGLSKADILYEVVVEGGITRMLAVFADPDNIPYTGPVRSVRHYYVDFAYPYDPIFVHFGGSPPGKAAVSDRKVANVDGLVYGTSAFYKDPERARNKGVEHSYFINSEGIKQVVDNKGYSMEGTSAPLLAISEEPVTLPDKISSAYVKFSNYANDAFTYNGKTGLYEKQRKGKPHIDADTGEVLTYANVIILSTAIKSYNGGDLREVALSGGKGYFLTGGGMEPITWKKGSYKDQFVFTDQNGAGIQGNVGHTFVALIDSSLEGSLKFE